MLAQVILYKIKKIIITFTELSHDPAISFFSKYLKNKKNTKTTCTRVFIAALFMIAKNWNQPMGPSTYK